MKIKVLLFAVLRERAGRGEMELEVEPGIRARDLPARIFADFPAEFFKTVRYAVNMDYVREGWELKEGDEVALIPPVAGG